MPERREATRTGGERMQSNVSVCGSRRVGRRGQGRAGSSVYTSSIDTCASAAGGMEEADGGGIEWLAARAEDAAAAEKQRLEQEKQEEEKKKKQKLY